MMDLYVRNILRFRLWYDPGGGTSGFMLLCSFLLGFRIYWIKIIVFLYLFVYFICRVESAHWALKRLLQNSLGDLCSVWEAMNNMITLQHTEIKASFETSTHMVGHVFKVTLYKRLLDMVSRYALNQIAVKFERVHYADKNTSHCGCVIE